MALAFFIQAVHKKKKFKAHFILVDHGIRKNSEKEAFEVKKLLKKLILILKFSRIRNKLPPIFKKKQEI